MTTQPYILVVEDEPKLANLLQDYLQASGFTVVIEHDGANVISTIQQNPPSLMLLDVMLPNKNGIDICREVRMFSSLPIVMVTAKVEEIDRLLGLELGADDYICKPFSPREVVARVKAILRRLEVTLPQQTPATGLHLDKEAYVASFSGKELDLTPVEFKLLQFLQSQPRKVFSRNSLLSELYDDHRIVTDRTVDTHIKNLRRKLDQADPTTEYITSVYGVGYKFDPQSKE